MNHIKLALRQLTGRMPQHLAELMRPVVTVPETMTGDRLIATFREKRTHQLIVVDAQGRVVGIVSLDDLLTDLLGTKDEAQAGSAGASPQAAVVGTAKGSKR